MRPGRYFEDFTPGALLAHWPGRTVFEADHRLYCALSLHFDYAGPVVHVGYLYSLLLGLALFDLSVNAIHHEELAVRPLAEVLQGDTIYARTAVLAAEDIPGKPDRGLVTFETRGYTQREELFMTFQRRMAIRRRPPG